MLLTFEQQAELSAIIDRLVYGKGDTYDVRDGVVLRDTIYGLGLKPEASVIADYDFGRAGAALTGLTSPQGLVHDDEQQSMRLRFGHGTRVYVGKKWAVGLSEQIPIFPLKLSRLNPFTRLPPLPIMIIDRFARSVVFREGYHLTLDAKGEPAAFCQMECKVLSLWGNNHFTLPFYKTLKTPVEEPAAARPSPRPATEPDAGPPVR